MTAALEVELLSAADARQLTDQIKVGVESVWHLVVRAYTHRAWTALGYLSWDDYCTREFGTARLRLPREERQEVVASLRDSGLSTRAIAAATGIARNTIRKDTEVAQIDPPAPHSPAVIADGYDGVFDDPAGDQLDGTAGESSVASTNVTGSGQQVATSSAAPAPAPAPVTAPVTPPVAGVTGLDGKRYPSTKSPVAQPPAPDRVEQARDLARKGYTSDQIAQAIGVRAIGDFCRRHGIEVHADAVVGKRRRKIDPERVIDESLGMLEGIGNGLDMVIDHVRSMDAAKRLEWLEALRQPLAAINRFKKELSS